MIRPKPSDKRAAPANASPGGSVKRSLAMAHPPWNVPIAKAGGLDAATAAARDGDAPDLGPAGRRLTALEREGVFRAIDLMQEGWRQFVPDGEELVVGADLIEVTTDEVRLKFDTQITLTLPRAELGLGGVLPKQATDDPQPPVPMPPGGQGSPVGARPRGCPGPDAAQPHETEASGQARRPAPTR